jgi:osmotically-inducible protein OsmY
MGLVLGVVGGVVAALLLAPKRRTETGNGNRPGTDAADAVLEVVRAAVHAAQWVQARLTATQTGLQPDERISAQIRSELERRGIWTPRIDVTTVDGMVFLRGREGDSVRAETIVGIARDVPGALDVVDEIRRE